MKMRGFFILKLVVLINSLHFSTSKMNKVSLRRNTPRSVLYVDT